MSLAKIDSKDKFIKMRVTKKKPQYVSHVYVKITVTELDSFCDGLASFPDWSNIGFKMDWMREPYYYHDANQCDTTFYLRKDEKVKYDVLYNQIQEIYMKHFKEYHWMDVSFQIGKSFEIHKYYIFRFNNLGLMQTLDQVEKYGIGSKENVIMTKLGDKKRPLRHTVEKYSMKTIDECEDIVRPDIK